MRIFTREVVLDANQIRSLRDHPITIAPAPGPGYGWQVLGFIISYTHHTTPYSGGGRLMVGPRAAVEQDYSVWETDNPPNIIENGPDGESPTGSWIIEVRQTGAQTSTPPELIDNQPLVFGNPNDDFEDGDGTLRATVRYAKFRL